MHLTHVNNKGVFDCLSVLNLEGLEELLRHRDESFFGPGQEPVNVALGEEGWELLSSCSELGTDWGEAKYCVQVVLNTIDEVVPEEES